jgi:S1-C subfamily serine protease
MKPLKVALLGTLACTIMLGVPPASAQSEYPDSGQLQMGFHGTPAPNANGRNVEALGLHSLRGLTDNIPITRLSSLAENPIVDLAGKTRSARDVQLYRTVAPSVVFVVNKEGFGSGSLLDTSGDILTNWHVVNGYEFVGVIFKPALDGQKPTRDDIKLAHVVKYDEVSDLALIRASEVPANRTPIRLGNSSEIAVGMDVHAIGHPEGDAWTYTTGIISQYREGFSWRDGDDSIQHKADIIQTQTPINPGNSGGPLLNDAGALIGVNAFKDKSAEGLNFAISVESVRSFLARSGNRVVQQPVQPKTSCAGKKLATFRNQQNDATITSFDLFCTGKDNAEYVVPDDKTKAIFFRVDRNGDGKADVMYFDLKRRGKWDLSFWDNDFVGHWTLVGYHDDGSLKPTRFESYETFQKRIAQR